MVLPNRNIQIGADYGEKISQFPDSQENSGSQSGRADNGWGRTQWRKKRIYGILMGSEEVATNESYPPPVVTQPVWRSGHNVGLGIERSWVRNSLVHLVLPLNPGN